MKGMGTVKKLTVAVAVCMAVLCLPGYSEPTPEQVKERTELLVQAIMNNNVEQAKLCIKLGADVNAKVYEGRGDGGHLYLTTNKNLITSSEFDVYTIPTLAMAARSSKDIIELLVKSGADINAKSSGGETMLIYAANKKGWQDIIEILIKAGADINANAYHGQTALMNAASKGHKDTAEVLIKAGADVNAKSKYGWTALMETASCEDCKDIAELLIQAGADVNAKNDNGETALTLAAYKGHKDTAELLIKSGADKNAVLIWAVERNDSNAMKLLINVGANVNAKDSEGISALDYAILYGKKDIADLLRAAGARE